MVVIDDTAVIGSANLSGSSLYEAGLITTDHVIVAGVASLIHDFTRLAQPIDEAFLRRIEKIPVNRRIARAVRPRGGARRRVLERGKRTWLVAVTELRDSAFPEETETAERGETLAEKNVTNQRSSVTWVRMTGKSQFGREARKGDSVIRIWRARGSKRPRVFREAPILYVQHESTCTRVYLEEKPQHESASLSWSAFERLAQSAGLRATRRSTREVAADVAQELIRRWRAIR